MATEFKTFKVEYTNQPWRNRSFKVRGICKFDVLNPCWNNRQSDVIGQHWGSEPGMIIPACDACTKAAIEHKKRLRNKGELG